MDRLSSAYRRRPAEVDKFEKVRKLFPVTKRLVYFNHAAVSPLSSLAVKALERQVREQMEYGVEREHLWEERAESGRRLAAGLLNAKPAEIAFVKNTTEGLNLFARGLDWRRGDNVVLPRVEFPANVYPWLSLESRGVNLKFIKERNGRLLVEDIEEAIDSRTRVVAISFVEFSSGYRNDLERIGRLCRKRGVHLVVDGIQGVGALGLDVKKCNLSALSAGGHKWLLSPQGTGIFYCPLNVMRKLDHPTPGWMSVVGWTDYYNFKYNLFKDSRRYESAQRNLLGLCGLTESLKLIDRLGIANIEKRILGITDHLCGLLEKKGFEVFSSRRDGEKSGIVSFFVRGRNPDRLREALRRKGIIVSARDGRLRASPHYYNSFEEVERLVSALPS
jgi:cysteine desulfurase/selenocysteine lyase